MSPTTVTALVKSNDYPLLLCAESASEESFKLRKILFGQSELNALLSGVNNEIQTCQQALNDENDKRDMYKVGY